MQKVLDDFRTAPIRDELKRMLAFVDKLARTPGEMTAEDARVVLDAGVTEQMFVDALSVQAMFHFITRCADAFDFEIPPQSGFVSSAKMLLKFGYKL